MKTIKEIFKNNPSLVDEPEVKELLLQFKEQFNGLKNKHNKYWDAVTDITMNSECFVIKGIPCETAIKKINALSFNL